MSEPLTGRALAEAALKIMGIGDEHGVHDGPGGFNPGENAAADYVCLEWAREHWQGKPSTHRAQWLRFRAVVGDHGLEDYEPGMWARALVAASKEGGK